MPEGKQQTWTKREAEFSVSPSSGRPPWLEPEAPPIPPRARLIWDEGAGKLVAYNGEIGK
jgi:hypothetical protein